MKKKCLFVIAFLLIGIFLAIYDYQGSDFKTDYYEAVNQEIFRVHSLEDGEYAWSRFIEAQEESDDCVEKIVSDIVSGDVSELDEVTANNIRAIYRKAVDMETRDEEGISILESFIYQVMNSQSISELVDAIVNVEEEFGIDILTNIVVDVDYVNHERNIIYFYPVTFAFGASSDYIVNPDYMTYKAYLRRACVQLWKAYGYDTKEAREVVKRIFSFYEEIGNHSKLASDLADISSYYQIYSKNDFSNVYSNIDMEYYLKKKGIFDIHDCSIVDVGQYQYLNNSLVLENLDLWKEVIVMKILSSYAIYGSSEYVDVVTNLNHSLLGISKESTIEDQALDIVSGLYSEEVDQIFERKVLRNDQEEMLFELFLEIKDYYRKMLESNQWLQPETIEKALIKLDNMKVVIGLDDEREETFQQGVLDISQDSSLLEDVISIIKMKREKELIRLSNGQQDVLVTQSTVNAYYQPLDNSIVIPAAFVYLLTSDDDYYQNLGSIGMIIAHEITHGFDGNGSQFDENGNMKSWWTEEDYLEFDRLKKKVSAYYSQYEVINGKYINGEKTVNENIADLGAMSCIVGIARENKASDDEMKVMFSSFVSLWASQESDAYMELLLLQDVHAPNKYRVNAVLSSIDDFYRVYDVHQWNGMSISKQDRVSVWQINFVVLILI